MIELGLRLVNFYTFIWRQGWDGGIVWFENNYHVTISCNGKIFSYGEEPTLTAALNSCLEGLQKVGF